MNDTDNKPVSIALTNCAKTFTDGTRALEPLDLAIHAGETVVFLGPSGCGKTTTLRIIAGLEEPDAGGKVLFDGVDVTHLPIEQRNVGMVFQSYALFPNMTVAGNIGYGLKIRKLGKDDIDARVRKALRDVRHVYLLDSGRISVAGLNTKNVKYFGGWPRLARIAAASAPCPEPERLSP